MMLGVSALPRAEQMLIGQAKALESALHEYFKGVEAGLPETFLRSNLRDAIDESLKGTLVEGATMYLKNSLCPYESDMQINTLGLEEYIESLKVDVYANDSAATKFALDGFEI